VRFRFKIRRNETDYKRLEFGSCQFICFGQRGQIMQIDDELLSSSKHSWILHYINITGSVRSLKFFV